MAALVKILYDNKALAMTWTASTQVATLPAKNAASAVRVDVWQSTSPAAQWLKGQAAAPIALDGFAIYAGNLTTAAVVNLRANATDAWGAPAFTQALVPWAAPRTNVMLALFPARQTYLWWRLEIDDPTNPAGHIQAKPFLSPLVAFTRGPNRFRYWRHPLSATRYSAGGTPYTTERPDVGMVEIGQPSVDDTLLFGDDLQDAITLGQRRDVVLSFISGAPSGSAFAKATNLYGRFDASPDFQWVGPGGRFDGTLRLRESL